MTFSTRLLLQVIITSTNMFYIHFTVRGVALHVFSGNAMPHKYLELAVIKPQTGLGLGNESNKNAKVTTNRNLCFQSF